MIEERKNRIAEFIESLDEGDISSSTVLLGGAKKKEKEEEVGCYNGLDCKNANYDGCDKSTNKGRCLNEAGMCDNSKNYGGCNNSYRPHSDNTSDNCTVIKL